MSHRFDDWHPHNPAKEQLYTVTIYLAAPGTPIKQGEEETRSRAGHMYYMINDGKTEKAYGFSPIESGASGPGHVVENEHLKYQNPAYSRTIQITAQQYEKFKEYGETGARGDETYFNLEYGGLRNSCIDFTWGALNHAGLHTTRQSLLNRTPRPVTDFEGDVKVLDNKEHLQRIPAPFPDSKLNQETENPLPERDWLQRQLTENQPDPYPPDFRDPAHPGHLPFATALSAVRRMERANGIVPGPHSEKLAGALAVKAAQEDIDLGNAQLSLEGNGQLGLLGHDGRRHALDTQQAIRGTMEAHTAAWNQTQAGSTNPSGQALANPLLARLPVNDRLLFERIRDDSPADIDDARVMQAMYQAKQNGIRQPEQLDQIVFSGDKLLILGNTPGYRATIDTAEQAPGMQETLGRNDALNRQLAQQQDAEAQSRQQAHAMRMG
ncbi:hypothetical protein EBB59_08055 [Lysobacter pythonis]|uniref:X-Tfes XVIPCD domain-containing protein n=1 Tax=Solilutibacter pythonis TaxID=2483112 RepID=A0A3M2HZQ2_9GAMM|nr:XVIPCD domain-containing protein [Lysobacter pythonis]RMH92899.1 hypothetical protein EBB59_08055 [Lysobacter pythonis]